MNTFFRGLISLRLLRIHRVLPLIFCVFMAARVDAQNSSANNSLRVDLVSPVNGTVFKIPQPVPILAFVSMPGRHKEGDTVQVEFYANTNRIGSATSSWHPAKRPQERPGQAVPLYVIAAGFSPVQFNWKNPQPGRFALTARAIFGTNSAVSARVTIAVLAK